MYSATSPDGFNTSYEAVITFTSPGYIVPGPLSYPSPAVTGGHSANGIRYIHAGESIGLESTGSTSFFYRMCTDNSPQNGKCDEYDTAARAFGDFDSSGSVNGADLAALLAAWGSSGSACDINRDGNVDGTDLTFLLSRWGQGAP